MHFDPDRPDGLAPARRSLRRHHRERMIAHARAVLRNSFRDRDETDAEAVRVHDYLTACSCPMCGNRRRSFGERTWQEIRVACLPLRGGRKRVEIRD